MYLKMLFFCSPINGPGPFRPWAIVHLLIAGFRIRRMLLLFGSMPIPLDEQALKKRYHGNHLFFNVRPGLSRSTPSFPGGRRGAVTGLFQISYIYNANIL